MAFGTVFIAAIGAGIGGELFRRYNQFKNDRRRLDYRERNTGFWTDVRLLYAEAGIVFGLLAPPASMMVILLGTRSFWHATAGVLGYVAFCFVLLRGLNRQLPER